MGGTTDDGIRPRHVKDPLSSDVGTEGGGIRVGGGAGPASVAHVRPPPSHPRPAAEAVTESHDDGGTEEEETTRTTRSLIADSWSVRVRPTDRRRPPTADRDSYIILVLIQAKQNASSGGARQTHQRTRTRTRLRHHPSPTTHHTSHTTRRIVGRSASSVPSRHPDLSTAPATTPLRPTGAQPPRHPRRRTVSPEVPTTLAAAQGKPLALLPPSRLRPLLSPGGSLRFTIPGGSKHRSRGSAHLLTRVKRLTFTRVADDDRYHNRRRSGGDTSHQSIPRAIRQRAQRT